MPELNQKLKGKNKNKIVEKKSCLAKL